MRIGVLLLVWLLPLCAWAEAPITKLPQLTQRVDAVYPQKALQDRVEAVVQLELDISDKGEVEQVVLVNGPAEYGFVEAAVAAAHQFVFDPAEAGGDPVPVRIGYTYRFVLPIEPIVTSSVVRFSGVVRQAGTRALIPGAMITVFQGEGEAAHGFEATTDEQGAFTFYQLDAGSWKVLVESTGSYPLRTSETFTADEGIAVTFYLEKGSYNPYDVTVAVDRGHKEVTRRTLSHATIVKVAGTLGDPIQVVESLPGVARSEGGQLIVRGSGPEDTRVYIDSLEVPLIYHFGGLRAVIPVAIIDSVDFYPGNFSVAYGRGMGGVVNAQLRRLAPDQLHGAVDLNLLDASIYIEVPLFEDAAILAAFRRSHIDLFLDGVVSENTTSNLVSTPQYYDYQLLANWRPANGHDLRLFFFGSDDALDLLFDNTAENNGKIASGALKTDTRFNRLSLQYRAAGSVFENDLQIAGGNDIYRVSIFEEYSFAYDTWQIRARDVARWQVMEQLTLHAGFDTVLSFISGRAEAPPQPEGDVIIQEIEDEQVIWFAPFVEAELKVWDLTFVPGLRLDYDTRLKEVTLDPRLVVRWGLGSWTLKAGAGIVHQSPQSFETDMMFGNPDLSSQYALQYSVGAEWKPLSYLAVDATVFYKDMHDLVGLSSELVDRDGRLEPEIYNNDASGRVFGLELYVEHNFNNNLRGWLSYTLSRAERTDGETVLFDYDQTHIFSVVASYLFRENWTVGLRWRLISGNPYTPYISGVFLSDLDRWVPISGATASARMPMFHQLDLLVEKKWIFDTWMLSAYINLTNAYNRSNTEAFVYKYDYTETNAITGLPMLPILGLRGEL